MGKKLLLIILISFFGTILILGLTTKKPRRNQTTMTTQARQENNISLPSPKLKGETSLEQTISKRRSKRNYQDKSLALEQVSQVLWAGQGITEEKMGFRAAPSAGALYPLDLYLIVGQNKVEKLEAGVYHYLPKSHQLETILVGDLRKKLMKASLDQSSVGQAPIVLVITGEYERTTKKYGERGIRYVFMEAGHAAQNIYLQVASLGLGTVTIGAFSEEEIIEVLNLPPAHRPLYVMPIGYPE